MNSTAQIKKTKTTTQMSESAFKSIDQAWEEKKEESKPSLPEGYFEQLWTHPAFG